MSDAPVQIGGFNVLALHGFAARAAVWDSLAKCVMPPARLTALNLPGHGGAPRTLAGATLDGLAKTCAAALNEPAVWLGWSLGGLVALHAAHRHPQKVLGVVTVAISPRFLAAADWPNALSPKEFMNFKSLLKQDPVKALGRFYALQIRTRHGVSAKLSRKLRALALGAGVPQQGVLEETLSMLGGADLRDEAAALSCPVMSVLGEDDLLVPSAVSEDIARLNPAWRVEVMAAAGHVPFLSHPAAFLSLFDSFMRALDAARGAA